MDEELEEQENEEGKEKEKKEAVKREKVGRRKLKISFIIATCNLEKEKKRKTRRGEE